MPTKCSMSRPCACELAWRPRRLFGLIEPADGAPCSGTGLSTQGAGGLPSATAAPTLRPCREEREIQGARAAGVSKDAQAAIHPHRSHELCPEKRSYGIARRARPGIHEHRPLEYGFGVRGCAAPPNDRFGWLMSYAIKE